MTAPPDLSIVLINWNTYALTAAAIESIERQTRDLRYEVIVVDNGSTRDDSVRELPRRFPSIRLISNPRNMGFSVSSNQGIGAASGRHVLLLNSDTIQTEDALSAAVRYMAAHPDVGALGIAHRNADAARSRQPSAFRFPRPWREVVGPLGLPFANRHVASLSDEGERDVDWVCGSFLLMRRECLEHVGPLDERFFAYDEDIDWCRRAWDAGWRVRFWSGASMIHVGGAARPFMKDKTFVHFRSRLSYIRKHHGVMAAAMYYAFMAGRLSLATGWQALRWLAGRARLAEVRERWSRQRQFALLRPGQSGG